MFLFPHVPMLISRQAGSIQTVTYIYNIQAVSFTPGELVEEMEKHIAEFVVAYRD